MQQAPIRGGKAAEADHAASVVARAHPAAAAQLPEAGRPASDRPARARAATVLGAAVEAVLERHAGRALWVDTSVRDERIAPGGRLLPAWRALFEGHPERFVVAVDAFSTQRWGRYGEVVASVRTSSWGGSRRSRYQLANLLPLPARLLRVAPRATPFQ